MRPDFWPDSTTKGIFSFRMNKQKFSIRQASWQQDRAALQGIREVVFVQEQKVPRELEWDKQDRTACHFLAEDENGNPIGTARLLDDGQIGRMAVLKPWRSRGVGSALLVTVLTHLSSSGCPKPFLNAQTRAVPFYQRHGFQIKGDVFLEAAIPHLRMEFTAHE